MQEIKNGLILNGQTYEVFEDKFGRGKACKLCDLNKECADYVGAFCYWFEDYFNFFKSEWAIYFKKVNDEEDLHSRQGNR